jgi:hypothetical protein
MPSFRPSDNRVSNHAPSREALPCATAQFLGETSLVFVASALVLVELFLEIGLCVHGLA